MKYRVVLQRLAVQDLGDAFSWVGGHGAAADNEQAALMDALAFAFLWKELKK
jgi:prolyl oligopeptidase PreP (S9A serine peptidase family)